MCMQSCAAARTPVVPDAPSRQRRERRLAAGAGHQRRRLLVRTPIAVASDAFRHACCVGRRGCWRGWGASAEDRAQRLLWESRNVLSGIANG